MRAVSTKGFEIGIYLDEGEVIKLKNETLKCCLRLRDMEDNFLSKDLELRISELSKGLSLYIEMDVFPIREWDIHKNIEKFEIRLSEEGYEVLKESGYVVDRYGGGGRVDIYKNDGLLW